MPDSTDSPAFLRQENMPALAYHRYAPENPALPTVVFLGGFRSDMQGSKALYLDEACRARQQPFIRFDYRGHGQSAGAFEEGCIGLWLQDALRVIDALTQGPLLLVGSSMGGWIGLLAARTRPERVCGFIGIAAAPDFTKDMHAALDDEQRAIIACAGIIRIPNHYSDDPYVITKRLLDDGPAHYLLEKPLELCFPVRLLQGMNDEDVPWKTAFRIKSALVSGGNNDTDVLLLEEGNHRLSRPEDLALLDMQVCALSGLARR